MSHLPTLSCFENDGVIAYSTQLFTQHVFFSDRNIIKNKNEIFRFVSREAIEQIDFLFHLFEQEFTTIMYFRQYWMDRRLQYNNTGYSKRLAFNPQMLKFIWVPDTHFPGIKDGLKHDITDTNEVIRLWPNGSVLYSMR